MRRIDTGAIVFSRKDYERWQRENPNLRVGMLEGRVASLEDRLETIEELLRQIVQMNTNN